MHVDSFLLRKIFCQVVDGDFVLDIGANIGLFSLYLMSKFERLNIIALEPIPKVFEVLTR
jgi:tRNA1(Val) A37 N6-methylase TrmN6